MAVHVATRNKLLVNSVVRKCPNSYQALYLNLLTMSSFSKCQAKIPSINGLISLQGSCYYHYVKSECGTGW